MASCSSDGDVKLWESGVTECVMSFTGHVAPVTWCDSSITDRLLVSSSQDKYGFKDITMWIS